MAFSFAVNVCVCSSWKKLLEASKLEVVLGSYKWWFHIYGLCKDFITGTAESKDMVAILLWLLYCGCSITMVACVSSCVFFFLQV